jgi:hypothetical protein
LLSRWREGRPRLLGRHPRAPRRPRSKSATCCGTAGCRRVRSSATSSQLAAARPLPESCASSGLEGGRNGRAANDHLGMAHYDRSSRDVASGSNAEGRRLTAQVATVVATWAGCRRAAVRCAGPGDGPGRTSSTCSPASALMPRPSVRWTWR